MDEVIDQRGVISANRVEKKFSSKNILSSDIKLYHIEGSLAMFIMTLN